MHGLTLVFFGLGDLTRGLGQVFLVHILPTCMVSEKSQPKGRLGVQTCHL